MANHTQIDIYTIVDQVAEDRGEHEHGFAIEVAQKVQDAYEEYLSSVAAQRDELLAAVKAISYEDGGEYYIQVNSGQSFGPLPGIKQAIARCEVRGAKWLI